MIDYRINQQISVEQFSNLLDSTSLGPRRPLDKPDQLQGMLDNADLLVTAWKDEHLVGVARSVTDFHYCCYLSDLAVSESVQAQGIGKELIRATFSALNEGCSLILLAAPLAVDYDPKIGFERHDSCWLMRKVDQLK